MNPFYGRKGMGFMKSPKKSVRAAVYRRNTFSVMDLFRKHGNKRLFWGVWRKSIAMTKHFTYKLNRRCDGCCIQDHRA